MYVVQVVVAVGIVLATVLVAGGRGDGLQPTDLGRARTPLPSDRPLVADDLQRVRLGVGLRGYRMDEVDELMDRAAVELAQRDERIAELERMRIVAASTAPLGATTPPGVGGTPATGGAPTTWPTSAAGREWAPTDG